MDRPPNPAPWSYTLIRLLFKFVLKVFYGTIVVENAELIPEDGRACIVCANHSNALTDALMLITSVPSNKRSLLRLTAKATLFGKRTLSSWLIESVGTLPIKRKKDDPHGDADNSESMSKLMQALEEGDAVCLFPEGISRYHPAVAPLKTGVARLLSDVLSKNRGKADFQVSVLTCSITYLHRQRFRSDVLVTFQPPMTFTPKFNPELLSPVDFADIRKLTAKMQANISEGTIDAPTWDIVRSARLATKIYAPLGTGMSLGDHVRICRSFVEVFKSAELGPVELDPFTERVPDPEKDTIASQAHSVNELRRDLKHYQDDLVRLGIKDNRIRQSATRRSLIRRLITRSLWIPVLILVAAPGAILWLPIFLTTYFAVKPHLKTGPIWNTWDEIAQLKLLYGLVAGITLYVICIILTLPFSMLTAIVLPIFMWLSLRWLEDTVAACRAWMALIRLLRLGREETKSLAERRKDLHGRVMNLAIQHMDLPPDPETFFLESGVIHKGRVRGSWDANRKYFSVRRRRKRDWDEILRLYDEVDFPEDTDM